MFLQKRVINGLIYTYVDHSFRIGNKVKKISLILDQDKQDYNETIIEKIAVVRAAYFTKNVQTYFSEKEIIQIEVEKLFYQIFFNVLGRKCQQEIFEEFLRLFLANSMELEGSTITPRLAENIDNKKKIVLPEAEIKLYTNSKNAFREMMSTELRSVIQFKQFHQKIYHEIIPEAGNFKKTPNTFGYTEKAKTIPPEEVRRELKNTLKAYQNKAVYPFLKPLLFHLNYQRVHPFADGNSRLGRMILVRQMFKQGYPPLIFKGDMSFQIRETLIEFINHNHLDFCRLCLEQYLQTAKKFWRPMIKKYLYYSQ